MATRKAKGSVTPEPPTPKPTRVTHDGMITTEHFDDQPYIESTLLAMQEQMYATMSSRKLRTSFQMEIELSSAIIGSYNRVTHLLSLLKGKSLSIAREAIEIGMRAVQADAHVMIKGIEPEVYRDYRRQKGTKKERRPEITEWIVAQLKNDPKAKSPEMWRRAPQSISDQIDFRAFAKRVTAQRKKTRASN